VTAADAAQLNRAAQLSREALAALGAAARQHVAATNCRHAMTEAMAALAHDFAGLVGAFHVKYSIASKPRGATALSAIVAGVF
jgi:hypothetical protein